LLAEYFKLRDQTRVFPAAQQNKFGTTNSTWRAHFRVSQRNGNRGQLLNCASDVPCNQDAVVWTHLRRTYANSPGDTSPLSPAFPPSFCSFRANASERHRTRVFLRTTNL